MPEIEVPSTVNDFRPIAHYNVFYRILSKIKRIPDYVVENVINHFDDFQSIISANMEQLDEVEGVGAVRARNIAEGLRRIKERYSFDRK